MVLVCFLTTVNFELKYFINEDTEDVFTDR